LKSYILWFFWVLVLFFSSFLNAQKMAGIVKTPEEVKNEERFITALYKDISGKREEAIKILDTIRRESPSAAVYFQLARWYMEKEDYINTENNLQTAIKLDANNIWIREFESEFYTKIGDYPKAINAYNFLIERNPQKSSNYTKLVNIYIKKGDTNMALATLERQEIQIGRMESIVLRKAEIYDNTNQVDKAVKVIDDFGKNRADEKDFLHLIVNLLKSNDKIQDIEPYLKRILSIDPNDKDAQLDLFLISNKKPGKIDVLLALRPMVSNPNVNIDIKIRELFPFVSEHAQTSDTLLGKQLISLMDDLVIAHPNEVKAHAINADILKNSGNFNAAVRQYEKTLSLSKRQAIVWEQYMFCLEAISDYKTLAIVSEEAIDYFPNEALFYYFAGLSRYHIGGKDYQDYLNDALIIGVGNKYVESTTLALQGEIFLAKNDIDKAMELAKKSFEVSEGKSANSLILMGDIAKVKNDYIQAKKHFEDAIKMGGNVNKINIKLKGL